MPQPPENTRIADQLIQVYRNAQARLTQAIADAVESSRAQSRLRALLAQVDSEMAAVEQATRVWLQGPFVDVYAAGATTTAADGFVWTQAHREAVQDLATQTWDDLLQSTRFVRRDTKAVIRRLTAEAVRSALLEGVTAQGAGVVLADAVIAETGALTVTYSNGAKHAVADYADTVVRTATANSYNEGTFVQADQDGFAWMEVFDGPNCGWTSHDDSDKANGTIRSLADCRAHPLSHPRCARSFSPAVGASAPARRLTPAEQARQAAEEAARAAAQPARFSVAAQARRRARQTRTPRTPRQRRGAA